MDTHTPQAADVTAAAKPANVVISPSDDAPLAYSAAQGGPPATDSALPTTPTRREVAAKLFADMSREDVIEVALAGCDARDSLDREMNDLVDTAENLVKLGRATERQRNIFWQSIKSAADHLDIAAGVASRKRREPFYQDVRLALKEMCATATQPVEWEKFTFLRPKPVMTDEEYAAAKAQKDAGAP